MVLIAENGADALPMMRLTRIADQTGTCVRDTRAQTMVGRQTSLTGVRRNPPVVFNGLRSCREPWSHTAVARLAGETP